jgi:Sulfotransferase domain
MQIKVFGIGLNKTGTSSLRIALETLGYRVSGPNKKLLKQVRSGNAAGLIAHTSHYDAFEDFPYPLAFRELHQHYGSIAKFVLTTRHSGEAWYQSICEHARTSRVVTSQRLAYGFYRPFGRKDDYIALYENHNEAVRAYFRANDAQGQLLEVCWEKGDGWKELCAFLNAPVPELPFPHRNKSDKRRYRIRRAINKVVEAVYVPLVRRAGAVSQ